MFRIKKLIPTKRKKKKQNDSFVKFEKILEKYYIQQVDITEKLFSVSDKCVVDIGA